jgi:hypothetical protein
MLWSKSALAAGLILTFAASATAQTVGQAPGQRQESTVRIQNNFNFFVAAPSDDSEEAQRLRERARRLVYELAARECTILLEVLAKECRLETVSSSVNRQQYNAQQPAGFTINGSMNLVISMK